MTDREGSRIGKLVDQVLGQDCEYRSVCAHVPLQKAALPEQTP